MKHAALVTSTAAAATLFDLLKHSDPNSDGVLLELRSGTVSIGNPSAQPFPLVASEKFFLENQRNTKSVVLIGVGTVAVGLF